MARLQCNYCGAPLDEGVRKGYFKNEGEYRYEMLVCPVCGEAKSVNRVRIEKKSKNLKTIYA